jgi:hypothetical protein
VEYLLVKLDKCGLKLFSDIFSLVEMVLEYSLTVALVLVGLLSEDASLRLHKCTRATHWSGLSWKIVQGNCDILAVADLFKLLV